MKVTANFDAHVADSLTGNGTAGPRKITIMAPFPPNNAAQARHASRLCQGYIAQGCEVSTYSTHNHSVAQYHLSLKSAHGLRSLAPARLAASEHVYLYSSSLNWALTHPVNTLRLLLRLYRHSSQLTILSGRKNTCLMRILFWLTGNRRLRATPIDRAASSISGHAGTEASPETVLDFLVPHALGVPGNTLQLTPTLLRKSMGPIADEALKSDMDNLLEAVVLPGFAAEVRACFHQKQFVSPAAKIAYAAASDGGDLARIHQHAQATLKLAARFALKSPKNQAAFRKWLSQRWSIPETIAVPNPELSFPGAAKSAQLASLLLDFARGQSRSAKLDAPIGKQQSNLTLLELMLALVFRLRAQSVQSLLAPWSDHTLLAKIRQGYPECFPTCQIDPPAAIELTGLANSATGIGQNFWMSAATFAQAGIPARLVHVGDDPIQFSDLNNVTAWIGDAAHFITAPTVIHHLNAERIPQLLLQPRYSKKPDIFHIGFLLWELDRLPNAHLLACDMLDEIWVPSRFLQSVYSSVATSPVHMIGKAVDLPSPSPTDRRDFGCSPADSLFVVVFDANSSVERKNPIAAARAFQRAFPKASNRHRLVIKTTPLAKNHWGDPHHQLQSLRAISSRDSRIILIEEYWTLPRLLGLIAASDCVVSSHRAEGFGYIPAYALKLGRPVIATDYSGTADYLSPETGYPIANDLVSVPQNQAVFATVGASWAEIDGAALVQAMRHVVANPEDAMQRAAIGQNLMQTMFSPAAHAQRYLSRLKHLGLLQDFGQISAPPLDRIFAVRP